MNGERTATNGQPVKLLSCKTAIKFGTAFLYRVQKCSFNAHPALCRLNTFVRPTTMTTLSECLTDFWCQRSSVGDGTSILWFGERLNKVKTHEICFSNDCLIDCWFKYHGSTTTTTTFVDVLLTDGGGMGGNGLQRHSTSVRVLYRICKCIHNVFHDGEGRSDMFRVNRRPSRLA